MKPLQKHITLLLLLVLVTLPTNSSIQQRKEQPMRKNYYCEYCGHKFPSIRLLTSGTCAFHPDGSNKGKHKLYEGSEKESYNCKYCGRSFKQIIHMRVSCPQHPKGQNKGRHVPAL